MALAIDSSYLAQEFMPNIQREVVYYTGQSGRWEVYRVCAHATVIHDDPTIERFMNKRAHHVLDLVNREELDWQADRDDDLDEMEVLHHLKHQAKTSPMLEHAFSQTDPSIVSTTLVTSVAVQSPSLAASAQGKSLSCFHRCFHRSSITFNSVELLFSARTVHANNFPGRPQHGAGLGFFPGLKVVGATSTRYNPAVFWQVQADFVDLLSRRSIPISKPGKRRRTTLNPFHRVSSPLLHDLSQRDRLRDAKRFKGVRYRPERGTWTAETKAHKHKNKLWFGEFKSPTEAARAIDAAFHYYGKPHLLNFPDTPQILSTRPSPPEGILNEEDKLRFVKEQGRWLASMASTLPSSPPWVSSEIPETSSRACSVDPLGFFLDPLEFRSFSEIASFLSCGDGDEDEADEGISQPPPSLHPDPIDGLLGLDYVGADAVDALNVTLEERQGLVDWNLDDALADPTLSARWSSSSSVHITDGWDDTEQSSSLAVWNLVNSAQPSNCETQLSWLNSLLVSAGIPMESSPSQFQRDSTPTLLEQPSFGAEWASD